MINIKTKQRELCYIVKIDNILPIAGADNCECAVVGGWQIMVRKNSFKVGDLAIYFEIDSVVPEIKEFEFLKSKNYKIKAQKYRFGGKGNFISQGLLMHSSDFGWKITEEGMVDNKNKVHNLDKNRFLTEQLGVVHIDILQIKEQKDKEQNSKNNKSNLIKRAYYYLITLFHRQNDSHKWPVGKFAGVAKTDVERCENMPYILEDKTPYIVTQKCDGSSATYILERKKRNKFEFYVCSRNIRMVDEKQDCYYDSNVYWEAAKKYDIENKMKDYLNKHKDCTFVCWQGECCNSKIQGNPHHLKELHLFCFHWIDSVNGWKDIREADKLWKSYHMEVVPIVDVNYILPNDFETFKLEADGYYDSSVCEGQKNCKREGFVYYKTTDPTFKFKNVSREYLLRKKA